jgi:hypothetical protein
MLISSIILLVDHYLLYEMHFVDMSVYDGENNVQNGKPKRSFYGKRLSKVHIKRI